MKLYLHIGTEKTGSSYLQTLLAINRKQLVGEKIFYPEAGNREKDMVSGKISPGNGKNLFLALKDKKEKLTKKILKQHISDAKKRNCETLLISNENLIEIFSQKPKLDLFLRICSEIGIEWKKSLLIIRNPVDQAVSLYKHRAKNGKNDSLELWLKESYDLPNHLDQFITNIKNIEVEFTIRKYQKDAIFMQKVVFIDWLQIELPDTPYDATVNPSLTISEIILLQITSNQNEQLVRPLYEKLLQLPFQEKANDENLEKFYRYKIIQFLIKFNSIWDKYNRILASSEQIDLPKKININGRQNRVLNFSPSQLEIIVEYFLMENKEVHNFRIYLKNVRRMIRYFKIKLYL